MTGAGSRPVELLSLAECLERLATRLHKSVSSSVIWRPFYSALCSGALVATGNKANREGMILEREIPIAREKWRELISEGDFLDAAYREIVFVCPPNAPADRRRFVCRVRIAESDFESWAEDKFPREEVTQKEAGSSTESTPEPTPREGDKVQAHTSARYPGRPSIKEKVLNKLRERHAAGQLCDTLGAEAQWLLNWARREFVGEPGLPSTPRSVENQIRHEYRNLLRPPTPDKKPIKQTH
jgi:hypothetical protein